MPYVMQERDPASRVLLQVIASVLEELVRKGEERRRKTNDLQMTKFHGLRAPSIALPDYLQRIAQFSGCSKECFVLMLVYIDRLVTNKEIPLDALNVHRLVITGTLLAAKFFDDHYLDNAHYSAVGGLPRNEINELELEFLFLLGFQLYVHTENYNTYYTTLTNMVQSRTVQAPMPMLVQNSSNEQQQPYRPLGRQTRFNSAQPLQTHGFASPQPNIQQGANMHMGVHEGDQWVHVNVPSIGGDSRQPQSSLVRSASASFSTTPFHDDSTYMVIPVDNKFGVNSGQYMQPADPSMQYVRGGPPPINTLPVNTAVPGQHFQPYHQVGHEQLQQNYPYQQQPQKFPTREHPAGSGASSSGSTTPWQTTNNYSERSNPYNSQSGKQPKESQQQSSLVSNTPPTSAWA